MNLTINSRNHGAVTFSGPSDRRGYIYVDLNGQPGTLGQQPCAGGGFRGETLIAGPEDFERVCRRWWRQYLANRRYSGAW